jgi:hypothetical protein
MKDMIKFAIVWAVIFFSYIGIVNIFGQSEEVYSSSGVSISENSEGISVPLSTGEAIGVKIIRARQKYFGIISLPTYVSGINMRVWNDFFIYSMIFGLISVLFAYLKFELYDKKHLNIER